jgi:mono/diheme cytochrome c family protein
MKKILLLLAAGFGFACFSFKVINDQPKKPWNAPENYLKMKNPVASNSESLATGKSIWNMQCRSCHGTHGKGDGPKAAQLNTEPGDFSDPNVQKEPDGSFFYKITEGRGDMPSFKKKIPDPQDIWSVVNYLRTFK